MDWSCAPATSREPALQKHEALSSNPSPTQKKKKKKVCKVGITFKKQLTQNTISTE
jgi:hypothetical protein